MPGVLYVALQCIVMHREVTGICWDCPPPPPPRRQEIARARGSGDRMSLPPIQTGGEATSQEYMHALLQQTFSNGFIICC